MNRLVGKGGGSRLVELQPREPGVARGINTRALKWCLMHGVLGACLVAGAGFNVTWAANIFLFVLWTGSPLAWLALCNKQAVQKMRALGPMVPKAVNVTYDGAVVLFLAACGWWLSAIVYAATMLQDQLVYEPDSPLWPSSEPESAAAPPAAPAETQASAEERPTVH